MGRGGLAAAAETEVQAGLLPGLVDGSRTGAVALHGSIGVKGANATGNAGVVLGGGLADVLLLAVGDDVVVIEKEAGGGTGTTPPNRHPTRRAPRATRGGPS